MKEKKKLLTWKQFSRKYGNYMYPHYDNFFVIFTTVERGLGRRDNLGEIWKKFEKEHPELLGELEKKLAEFYPSRDDFAFHLPKVDKLLYEAYKILISYGASQEKIFA